MKSIVITLSAACVVVAGYFGVRHVTHRDLGFTSARKYVRSLLETLLHTEVAAAREAGAAPATTTE